MVSLVAKRRGAMSRPVQSDREEGAARQRRKTEKRTVNCWRPTCPKAPEKFRLNSTEFAKGPREVRQSGTRGNPVPWG